MVAECLKINVHAQGRTCSLPQICESDYYRNNPYGHTSRNLEIRKDKTTMNVTQCCEKIIRVLTL